MHRIYRCIVDMIEDGHPVTVERLILVSSEDRDSGMGDARRDFAELANVKLSDRHAIDVSHVMDLPGLY